ncbi:MAG: type II toxin-antitoxin system HipA family toxin [Proteobacteria bacterium]|nr:type II toxin-antitoxin system HipA family toxin [Pseudomonadota bacterium]
MRLDQLRAVEEAEVWADDVVAGTLRRTDRGVQFEYAADYTGPALATTLPRDCGVIAPGGGGAVPPFFAGLLPEGRRLSALRRAAKTSADDDLTMLLAVGDDLIGHVRVLPPRPLPESEPAEPVGSFADVRFADVFAQVLSHDPADRVGLPGVQDKVSGRMISLPVRHANARWILKLDPPEFPHLVANEAFFLDAARVSGLPAAHHEVVHDRDGSAGLLVRRFDRTGGARLAQEDGCQACGRYPADKYRLTTEEVVSTLAAACGAPIVAARDLLRQFAFAYLTCNGDAHAKNVSVLRDRTGEWAVTQAYDVPSSHPYGDTSMALSVNGKQREDIGRADFLSLGDAVGVRPRAVGSVLNDLVGAIDRWLPGLGKLPFDDRRVHKLRKAIEYRAARLG